VYVKECAMFKLPHRPALNPLLGLLPLIGLSLSSPPAHDAPRQPAGAPVIRATLGNADNSVTIEARASEPGLAALHEHGISVWLNRAAEALPNHINANGADQPVRWHLDQAASQIGSRRVRLVYVADSPRLRLSWLWQARSSHGPLEHSIAIQNVGNYPVWLPLLPSIRFDWQIDSATTLRRFWVEKGADTPSSKGTHDEDVSEDSAWEGTSSTYARPIPGQPHEIIPYVLIHQSARDRPAWFLGLEFSGRTHISVRRKGDSLYGEAGLNPDPGPYRTRLLPGESFTTPTAFLGALTGGPDDAGNRLRRWVRAVLNSPLTLRDPHYPMMVNNSWGSGMAVDEPLARRMIDDSSELGLEMFHLDAGWFRAVGDWHADVAKFPNGIAPLADYAHRKHLKFGLWVDWTQAGVSQEPGALSVNDPLMKSWLTADPPPNWQHLEPFKGITMDLGIAQAQRWADRELERIVQSNHLDMLEHDGYLVAQGSVRAAHLDSPPDPATMLIYEDSGYVWAHGSNDTDVSYHATRAYYEIYERLRRRHPTLLLELCNDGGRMVDFGSAAHGDYFSITDTYDPLSNRRAFYDASYVLPPAMLESYVETWPTPHIENLRYMLRSGMLGWFSLMLDTSRWSAIQREAARAEFTLYKSALRPLIREADLYHVADRPDGVHWDGIEYYSARQRRGALYAFRGSAPDEPTHLFRLQGLDPRMHYRLHFQDLGSGADVTESGEKLMQEGIRVSLPLPLSSELVLMDPSG
jgi:hypothetical protein